MSKQTPAVCQTIYLQAILEAPIGQNQPLDYLPLGYYFNKNYVSLFAKAKIKEKETN
jgi:hypothetical protein